VEEGAQRLRLGDRREAPAAGDDDRPLEVGRRVALGPTRGNGIPEHLAADLAQALGGLRRPPPFDPAQDEQQLRRGHLGDGAGSEPREDIPLQGSQDATAVRIGHVRGALGKPLPGHGLEAVGGSLDPAGLLDPPLDRGVDVARQELAGGVALLPGVLQGDGRVDPQREALLFAGKTILEPPPLAPGGGNFQVQPLLVGQPVRFRGGLGGSDCDIGEHGGISSWRTLGCPQCCPKVPPDSKAPRRTARDAPAIKKPALSRACGLHRTSQNRLLVVGWYPAPNDY